MVVDVLRHARPWQGAARNLAVRGPRRLEDFAMKIVGIGSVGTRCPVGLYLSGDAAKISSYLGRTAALDQAIGEFALPYADQTVRDHAALVAAVRFGRIQALVEEDL